MQAMEQRLGEVGEVYRQGAAGKLSQGGEGTRAPAPRCSRRAAAKSRTAA